MEFVCLLFLHFTCKFKPTADTVLSADHKMLSDYKNVLSCIYVIIANVISTNRCNKMNIITKQRHHSPSLKYIEDFSLDYSCGMIKRLHCVISKEFLHKIDFYRIESWIINSIYPILHLLNISHLYLFIVLLSNCSCQIKAGGYVDHRNYHKKDNYCSAAKDRNDTHLAFSFLGITDIDIDIGRPYKQMTNIIH